MIKKQIRRRSKDLWKCSDLNKINIIKNDRKALVIYRLTFLFLLTSLQGNAQIAEVDGLYMVRNYLVEIRNTVNAKEPPKHKLEKLDSLIKSANMQKAVFNRNVAKITATPQEAEQLKSALNYILQSMILYRSDIKNYHESQSEIVFLNKNIPVLIYKIDFYSKRSKTRLEENTH